MKQLFLFLALFSTCALPKMSTSQKIIIGTVLDDSGHPLIGATVLVKDTTIGTITDSDGSFTLEVTDEKSILVISFTGYGSQEIKVGNQDKLTIVLFSSIILAEIVVTGYSDKARKKIFEKRQNRTAKALAISPIFEDRRIEP